MKLKAVPVTVFELFTEDGTTVGLFQAVSDWEGMQKLCQLPAKGGPSAVLIVDGAECRSIFAEIFSPQRAEVTLIKASPELALMLGKRELQFREQATSQNKDNA